MPRRRLGVWRPSVRLQRCQPLYRRASGSGVGSTVVDGPGGSRAGGVGRCHSVSPPRRRFPATGRVPRSSAVVGGRDCGGVAGTRRVPGGAWTSGDVAAYTGVRSISSGRLPPDGRSGRVRWWWPATVRTWWHHSVEERRRRQLRLTGPPVDGDAGPQPDQRWSGRDVARATGLTYDTVRSYRHRGRLPVPDGFTTGGRPWWRPDTITAWDQPVSTGRPRGTSRRRESVNEIATRSPGAGASPATRAAAGPGRLRPTAAGTSGHG